MIHSRRIRSSPPLYASPFVISSPLCCSYSRLQLWKTSLLMRRGFRGKSVGRQSNQGTICGASARGHRRLSHEERSRFEGWLSHRYGYKQKEDNRSSAVTGAIPTEVTAVATLLAVAGSLYALLQMNKDKLETWQAKKNCETCSGSGVCPTCSGEGFTTKNLSEEAVAKARANARDAATRYTAGLARKWNYCQTCQGARLCPDCQGRGWLQ
ncbi:hypothetical protein R1flu_002050 [Riccia fluitans]|uniref:DUF7895 domain-containing protein n=1 Tax=Riccia fluitans TaxID=41844 RepID=A0ABD1Y5I4_9MARC